MDERASYAGSRADGAQSEQVAAIQDQHRRQVKMLMDNISKLQRENQEIKRSSKDHNRARMIMSLRDKIRDLEYINDVLKTELVTPSQAVASVEEVNELIVRKTCGGPKRFRPLTRAELENKLKAAETKLKKRTQERGRSSGSSAAPSMGGPSAAARGGGSVNGSRNGDATQPGGGNDGGEGAAAAGSVSTSVPMSRVADMLDELDRMRIAAQVKDAAVQSSNEEIRRLKEEQAKWRQKYEQLVQQHRQQGQQRQAGGGGKSGAQAAEDVNVSAQTAAAIEHHQEQARYWEEEFHHLQHQVEDMQQDHEQEIGDWRDKFGKQLTESRRLAEQVSALEEELSAHAITVVDPAMAGAQAQQQARIQELEDRVQELEEELGQAKKLHGKLDRDREAAQQAQLATQKQLDEVNIDRQRLREQAIKIRELTLELEEARRRNRLERNRRDLEESESPTRSALSGSGARQVSPRGMAQPAMDGTGGEDTEDDDPVQPSEHKDGVANDGSVGGAEADPDQDLFDGDEPEDEDEGEDQFGIYARQASDPLSEPEVEPDDHEFHLNALIGKLKSKLMMISLTKKGYDVRDAFDEFDTNGDGVIDFNEFRSAMQNLKIQITDEELEAVVDKFDTNNDGRVDYDEFIAIVNDLN